MIRFLLFSFFLHLAIYFITLNGSSPSLPAEIIDIQISQIEKKESRSVRLIVQKSKSNSNSLAVQADSGQSALSQDSKSQYLSAVHELVKKQQTYPNLSKKMKEQGEVKIQLTLNASGELQSVELVQRSPFQRLNDAAINAATRAAPFQPFPQGIQAASWKIVVPIKFTLN